VLPKSFRISKEKDIQRAYRTKFQTRTDFLKIYLSQTSGDNFKSLVVVSKKIYKKANKRNRIRRRIYGLFDELKHSGRLPPRIATILLIQNKDIISLSSEEMKTQILNPLSSLYAKMIQSLTANPNTKPNKPK
jgi:ribonuclease P protein component